MGLCRPYNGSIKAEMGQHYVEPYVEQKMTGTKGIAREEKGIDDCVLVIMSQKR